MKLVILDRDGVINRDSDQYIKSPLEWRPISGSLEAIARLSKAGYHVVVITNQSGIARGLFDATVLAAIHEKMYRELLRLGGRIDAIYYCPHGPDDHCNCRKPKTGLFKDLSRRLRQDLANVPAIGDSLRDLQAAEAVGAWPILVRTGKGLATEQDREALIQAGLGDVDVFDDLATVVDHLLAGH